MSANAVDARIIKQLRAAADNLDEAAKTLIDVASVLADPSKGFITEAVERMRTAPADQRDLERKRMYYRINELAGAGLTVDGGHHKQWFLEQILEVLGSDPYLIEHERGIEP